MKNILDALITDRTQVDVERAGRMNEKGWAALTEAERAEYLGGPKGAYTRHDMNRVTGALAYLESLMSRAGETSAYQPILIHHVTINGEWTDAVWIDEDKPRAGQWAAYLANVEQYWDYVCRIAAAVIPRYDPQGNGYINPGESLTAGDVCAISDCCGLLTLTVDIVCDPGKVMVSGTAWEVKQAEDGYAAVYRYLEGPYPDIGEALGALSISCEYGEDVTDAELSLSAALRRGAPVELGRCSVRWSPYLTWGEFEAAWPTWGDTNGLTWDEAQRGGADDG